jgi:hypothetical protein
MTGETRAVMGGWRLLLVVALAMSMVAVGTAVKDPTGVQLSGSVMLIGKFDWEVS